MMQQKMDFNETVAKNKVNNSGGPIDQDASFI
jgi:hypothetical protein